jgi:hypothetical protein
MTDTPPPEEPAAPDVSSPEHDSGVAPESPTSPESSESPESPGALEAGAPPDRSTPRTFIRSVALAVVGFGATLILLFGLANVVRPDGGAGSPGAIVTASPTRSSPAARPSVATASPLASPSPAGSIGASPSPDASSSGAAPSPSTGTPSPSPAGDPVLVGAGDIADCSLVDDTATATLVEGIPGSVFTAGDNAYPNGTADQFRDCYGPTWGQFLDRTRPAAGNHDWDTKALAGYLGYFGSAAAPNGTSWYSYDLATWHVIVLDADCSNVGGCGEDSAQGRWLTADLAASTAHCTLAIWHQPRFSSGEHGNDASVAPFWTSLYAAGAELVINGHDHDYERFAPQDPAGNLDTAHGLREFVVGTGGAALRTFPTQVANSQVRAIVHGVLRLVLHPGSYEWTFLSTTGEFTDSGSGACH